MKTKYINYLSVILLVLNLSNSMAFDSRNKEALEQFALNTLKISSIYFHEGCGWGANIMDQNNYVYPVMKGSYIGKNYGKITKIEDNKIFITELIMSGENGWVERNLIFSKNSIKHIE